MNLSLSCKAEFPWIAARTSAKGAVAVGDAPWLVGANGGGLLTHCSSGMSSPCAGFRLRCPGCEG